MSSNLPGERPRTRRAPGNGAPLLEVRDLVVHHGQLRALSGISLTVFPGEVYALIGANGAGKSTLLRTIAGPAPPERRVDHLRRQGRDRAAAGEARHRGDRDGARGPAAVPVADPGGEPQGRHVLRPQGPVDHRPGLRAVPVDEGAARAEDRADVRRRAAVRRDRPRAGRQPPGAAARRAVARPRAGDRAAHLRHAAAGPGVRDHHPARRAGRQPGAARRDAPAVPARGARHA